MRRDAAWRWGDTCPMARSMGRSVREALCLRRYVEAPQGDLAVQADGKIVVGAGHFLFRFDPDGSPDTSFSDDGWVRTATAAYGVGLQADGKIVVTGPGKWEPYYLHRGSVRSCRAPGSIVRRRRKCRDGLPGLRQRRVRSRCPGRRQDRGRRDNQRHQRRREVRACALPGELTTSRSFRVKWGRSDHCRLRKGGARDRLDALTAATGFCVTPCVTTQ